MASPVWAEALYDFAAQEEGDLELKVGDMVRVTEHVQDDGWWEGSKSSGFSSVSGSFPAQYVKLRPDYVPPSVGVQASPKKRPLSASAAS